MMPQGSSTTAARCPSSGKVRFNYQIDDRTAALRAWHDAEITIGAGTEDEDYRQEAKERPVVRKITDLWREYGLRQ